MRKEKKNNNNTITSEQNKIKDFLEHEIIENFFSRKHKDDFSISTN